jgi:hypothetical protein
LSVYEYLCTTCRVIRQTNEMLEQKINNKNV